jgi:heme/copper-type cytochrome/quinol oxidase subunit 1
MSDIAIFVHDTYFVFGWTEAILSAMVVLAIGGGLFWVFKNRNDE